MFDLSDYPVLNCDHLPDFFDYVPCNDYKKHSRFSIVGMFVEDYYLERFWNRPTYYAKKFSDTAAVMSPDYSLLIGMPDPLLRYNVYRNRFVGAIWQREGLNVIPTVSWSDVASFEFCFKGIEVGSIVAVSNTGCKTLEQKKFFDAGFNEMKKRIRPQKIIFQCSHRLRADYSDNNIIFLDSFFDRKRKTWAEGLDNL